MILNGDEILAEVEAGNIVITGFDEKHIGPNSYDVKLDSTLLMYGYSAILDPRKDNPTKEIIIPKEGYLLEKNDFVLGRTVEYCENNSNCIVPMFEGKSSCARMGLSVHQAGVGDIGFKGTWTLELFAAKHIILYPNMLIGQLLWFWTNPTELKYETKGKYHGQINATASRSFMDKE